MLILCHSDEMSERLIKIFLFCCFFNRIDWMKSLLNPVFLLKNMYLYYTRCITVCKVQKTVIFDAFRQAHFVFSALFPAFCCPVSDW